MHLYQKYAFHLLTLMLRNNLNPSVKDWLNKLQCLCTEEYYAVIKKRQDCMQLLHEGKDLWFPNEHRLLEQCLGTQQSQFASDFGNQQPKIISGLHEKHFFFLHGNEGQLWWHCFRLRVTGWVRWASSISLRDH